MTKDDVRALLIKNGSQPDFAELYASAYTLYHRAEQALADSRVVFVNSKTGAPIKDPWLKIRAQAWKQLVMLRSRVRLGDLWSRNPDS